MKPSRIQVFEHTSLKVDSHGFTQHHFDQLVRYNENHKNQFFEVGHRRLYFGSFVGVIQVGQFTIEILPKADKSEADARTKWRDALLEMLKTCRLIRLESSGKAHLHLRSDSLVELYFEAYLFECEKLIRDGLRKSYRPKEGNRSNLKGRLVFSEQIKRNLIHKERFFTRYVDYNRNSLHNQILHRALSILKDIGSAHIGGKAKTLLLELEDIEPTRVTAKSFDRLTFDRNTIRYEDAIQLARLIILNYAPDLKGGSDNVIAILFDMNKLFEEYVYRCLKRATRDNPSIQISAQRSKVFWSSDQTKKTIRPDIVVDWQDENEAHRIVIDTKWKVPKANRPVDDDLKQMYVYNLQFGATQSALLYPSTSYSRSANGSYAEAPEIHDSNQQHSQLYFAKLFDEEGRLDKKIGDSLNRDLIPKGDIKVSILTSCGHSLYDH